MSYHYFEHPSVGVLITEVIWKNLHSGHLVSAEHFDPIMGLAVTAIVFALRQFESGVFRKKVIHAEDYEQAYKEVLSFIQHIRSPQYLQYCQNLILYSNTLVPSGKEEEEEEEMEEME
jgi:hypothetical protein